MTTDEIADEGSPLPRAKLKRCGLRSPLCGILVDGEDYGRDVAFILQAMLPVCSYYGINTHNTIFGSSTCDKDKCTRSGRPCEESRHLLKTDYWIGDRLNELTPAKIREEDTLCGSPLQTCPVWGKLGGNQFIHLQWGTLLRTLEAMSECSSGIPIPEHFVIYVDKLDELPPFRFTLRELQTCVKSIIRVIIQIHEPKWTTRMVPPSAENMRWPSKEDDASVGFHCTPIVIPKRWRQLWDREFLNDRIKSFCDQERDSDLPHEIHHRTPGPTVMPVIHWTVTAKDTKS